MALINAVRKDNEMEEFDYNGLDKAGDKYVSLSYSEMTLAVYYCSKQK